MGRQSSKRRKDTESCTLGRQHLVRVWNYHNLIMMVTPFSHTYTMLELRKCFLRHNWIDAAKLLLMLLDGGSLFLKRVMLKSCIFILLNHPRASSQHREEFIRMCSGGGVDADELMNSLLTFPHDNRYQRVVS
ncbi:uncharacterized protein LOC111867203 isoform X3 [Cryptotermes secundus]|uniref:uncharacterized protein LOC111867203 isoform X3 n=1 Tax=Cryptotermes secundus TaxID=105785 RepID=UPI001454E33D|nr:uncharacterized protein LOC111867203 isoform X3 [Cryptotermes secundus]